MDKVVSNTQVKRIGRVWMWFMSRIFGKFKIVQDTWVPYFRRNISAKIQPTLHKSTGVAYVDCRRTSGARYQSVTT